MEIFEISGKGRGTRVDDADSTLSGTFKKIAKEFGDSEAKRLFIYNPERIIRGETVQ